MKAILKAELRCVTKQDNNHKFEFENQRLTPNELIEKVKYGHWKPLGPSRLYQRFIRRKTLKNGQFIYDVLLCNCLFYTASLFDNCYLKRWNIERQFKYYKQYLNLGSTSFRK